MKKKTGVKRNQIPTRNPAGGSNTKRQNTVDFTCTNKIHKTQKSCAKRVSRASSLFQQQNQQTIFPTTHYKHLPRHLFACTKLLFTIRDTKHQI